MFDSVNTLYFISLCSNVLSLKNMGVCLYVSLLASLFLLFYLSLFNLICLSFPIFVSYFTFPCSFFLTHTNLTHPHLYLCQSLKNIFCLYLLMHFLPVSFVYISNCEVINRNKNTCPALSNLYRPLFGQRLPYWELITHTRWVKDTLLRC